MKTWEMIKALTENPKLKFKPDDQPFNYVHLENNQLCWEDGDLFDLNTINTVRGLAGTIGYEWELVRESVDFMTAVKAFDDLKVVECVGGNLPEIKVYKPSTTRMRPMLDQRGTAVTSDEILNCEWFVIE